MHRQDRGLLRDAIHTHFATFFGKWTIVGGWVKNWADKRGKVAKSKYISFVTSLERADKKIGWVGKKLFVHLPISVTKWVWMASLTGMVESTIPYILRFR